MYSFKHNIDPNKFNEFVQSTSVVHFQKTTYYGEYQKKNKQLNYETIGMYENQKLIATALVLQGVDSIRGLYFYVPTGLAIDYEDLKAVKEFLLYLKKYAKQKKACFIKIDPNVLRYRNTIDGQPLIDQDNHEHLTTYINDLGYHHRGYTYAYDGSWHNRFTLTIDLNQSLNDILAKWPKKNRNLLKRHSSMGISSRIGKYDELKYVEQYNHLLAEKLNFKPSSLQFFEHLYQDSAPLTYFIVTEMDLEQAIKTKEEEISSGKYHKDKSALTSCEKEIVHLTNLKAKYGVKPIINVMIFMAIKPIVCNKYMYSNPDFIKYGCTYNNHYFAMEYFKNQGYTIYDLVGFSGNTLKDDPYYSLYKYKSSLGSEWIENIGEFTCVIKPIRYNFAHILGKIRRIITKLKKH